jgi:CRISPR type III-A-associated RAMP protein Csm5
MKIKLLTPVHIGTGHEIPIYEWRASDAGDYWLRFDWFNIPLCHLPSDEKLRNVNLMKKEAQDLPWDVVSAAKTYTAKVAKDLRPLKEAKDQCRECMKNQATLEPIVPGSSLKGAILTGYLYGKYVEEQGFEPTPDNGRQLKAATKAELRGLLTGNNPVLDFSHRLKIRDIAFPQSTLEIDRGLRETKQRGTLRQGVECIAKGSCGEAKIALGSEHAASSPMQSMRLSDVEELVSRCNQFAHAVIAAEIDYYNYVGAKYDVPLPSHYDRYGLNFADDLQEKQCLVRVGWGSSKNAMSMLLLDSKPSLSHPPIRRPKSRWLLSDDTPPGWCRLTFETGDYLE